MHRHDHTRPGGDLPGDIGRIEIDRAPIDVGQHHLGADGQRIADRGHEGDSGNDHFVPWAEAGVGAVATQSFVDPSYGQNGLLMMMIQPGGPMSHFLAPAEAQTIIDWVEAGEPR